MLVRGFMSEEIRGVEVFRRERDETNQSLLFAKAREAGEEEEGERGRGGLTFNPIWLWRAAPESRHGENSNCNDSVYV